MMHDFIFIPGGLMCIELIYYNRNKPANIYSFNNDSDAQSVIHKNKDHHYLKFLLDKTEKTEPIDLVSVRYTFLKLNIAADVNQIKFTHQWYSHIKEKISELFAYSCTDSYIYGFIKDLFQKYENHFFEKNNQLVMVLSEQEISDIVPEAFYSRKFDKLCYYDKRINNSEAERFYKNLTRSLLLSSKLSSVRIH